MGTKITKTEGRLAKAAKTATTTPKRKVAVSVPASGRRRQPAEKSAKPRTEITTELIALRAYFISEQRAAACIPGDSLSDWFEAERQLIAEQQ